MTEVSPPDWRDEPRFAALRGVFEWMDHESALQVYDTVQQNCQTLALAIRRPTAFRAVMAQSDAGVLADIYTFLDLLVSELEEQEMPLTGAVIPWAILFRDMAAAEGIRRGLILGRGHNPRDDALASCIALTLGFDGGGWQ